MSRLGHYVSVALLISILAVSVPLYPAPSVDALPALELKVFRKVQRICGGGRKQRNGRRSVAKCSKREGRAPAPMIRTRVQRGLIALQRAVVHSMVVNLAELEREIHF